MSLIVNKFVDSILLRYKGKLYKKTGNTITTSEQVYACVEDQFKTQEELIFASSKKQDNFSKIRAVYTSVSDLDNESLASVEDKNNYYDITVILKNSLNPFFNLGSGNCLSLSGYQNLELNLISGKTYYFTQFDVSNTGNRLIITNDAAGNTPANITNNYTGIPGIDGVLFFVMPDTAVPETYYLSSEGGNYMGIKINVNKYYESLPNIVANFNILSGDSYYTLLPESTICNPLPTPTPTPTPTNTPDGITPTPTPTSTPTLTPTPTINVENDNILFDTTTFDGILEDVRAATIVGANRWENYIKINPAIVTAIKSSIDPTWNGIKLNSFSTINDPNSYIAACGVNTFVDIQPGSTGLQFCTLSFNLFLNLHYLNILTEQDWERVMAHELGHALGIGSYWQSFFQQYGAVPPLDNFLDGTSYTSIQNAYNNITSLNRTKMPLENSGGSGTQSAHWENDFRPSTDPGTGGVSYPGLLNELMVGFYSPTVNFVISDISIKALVDFGYVEKNPNTNEGIPTLVNSL